MADGQDEWYRGRDFRKLQKAWYKKLEEDGFYDIEGGVEGHLLKGVAGTVSLRSLANKSNAHNGLKNDRAPREFNEVADDENWMLNFSEGGKARYYHHAALLTTQAVREGQLPDELCYAWALHSLGFGERGIADMVGATRRQIRKHIAVLRDNINIRIDNEYQ